MRDSGHFTGPDGGIMLGSSYRRHRDQRRWGVLLFVASALVVVVAVGVLLWYRYGGGMGPWGLGAPSADTAPAPLERVEASPPERADTLDLPPLEGSDAFVRDLARGLSSHPHWTSWLVNDNLARRFVASVVTVSTGSTPREELRFMAPKDEVRIRRSDAGTVLHPATHRRYDLLTEAFVALDVEGSARLYRRLHPLFEKAHRELGFEAGTFDRAMARAVNRVLAVQVPDGPLRVESDEAVYVFQDPELESRSPLAKQLIRMGPDNARRIQAKLGELAGALELPNPTPDAPDRDAGR